MKSVSYLCAMRTRKDNKVEYTPLNLPKPLVEELKVWRTAYERANPGSAWSYERIIRGMLDCMDQIAPDVVAELDEMMKENPAILDQMANYTYLDAIGKRRRIDWVTVDKVLSDLLDTAQDDEKLSKISKIRPWEGGEVLVMEEENPNVGYPSDVIIVSEHCNIISWAFYIIRDNCQSIIALYPYREMYYRRVGMAALEAVRAGKGAGDIVRDMVAAARMLP